MEFHLNQSAHLRLHTNHRHLKLVDPYIALRSRGGKQFRVLQTYRCDLALDVGYLKQEHRDLGQDLLESKLTCELEV